MASQIRIINTGLNRLGEVRITSITDTTRVAVAVNEAWDMIRADLLSKHPWNFAIRDVELARLAGFGPLPLVPANADFYYKYQLPADLLRLLKVYGSTDFKMQDRKIITNESAVKIKYVTDITDTETWPPYFADLVSQRIAAQLAYFVTKSSAVEERQWTLYAAQLQQSKAIDGSEDPMDGIAENDSPLINVRF